MALPPGAVEDTVSKGGLPDNLGMAYPFIGCFLGYVGTVCVLRALSEVPSLHPWMSAVAFHFGGHPVANALSLLLFGTASGFTWGVAHWFIKDRRDALAGKPRR